MERQSGPQTPFEVFCHNCRTTFAQGTKHCIHCGERLSRNRSRPTLDLPPGSEDLVAEETTSPKRSLPVSPMTLLWVILLLGAGLQRACTPG